MKKNQSQSPVPVSVGREVEVQFSFPKAIEVLIGGQKIRRKEWGDEGEYGVLRESFLMIHRNDKFHTWIVSEGDMLALDWVIAVN